MKRIKILLALTIVMLLAPLAASADSQAASRLAQLLKPINNYEANFEQFILDGSGNRLQRTEGKMWLSRPGRFRWEVNAPYRQTVVSDGEKLYLYDPDLEQVSIRPLDTRVTHTPALLLSGGADALTENYRVSRAQQGTAETFTLVPKTSDTLFESLKLTFDGETFDALQMTDSTGQQTKISFDDVKLNPSLEESRFTFEIPEGADVIREGG